MNILQMSIQAGLLIAAIVIFRAAALYKLPKITFLVLWGMVLARMLIPFSFSSKLSIYNVLSILGDGTTVGRLMSAGDAIAVWNRQPQTKLSGWPGNGAEQDILFSISPLTILWIAGMAALFLVFCLLLVRSYRILRYSIPMENNCFIAEWVSEHKLRRPLRILQSDKITSPLSHGIMRPCIIFPTGIDIGSRRLIQYILAHEYFHIRRFDMLWKLLALCAVCIHWFNPLAWVMLFLFNRDLEISCDEMVLRNFGAAERAAYAHSLINMAEWNAPFTLVQNHFSKKAAEERIVSIMKYKKFSALATALALVLVVGLAAAFTTSAQANAVISGDKNESKTGSIPSKPVYTSVGYNEEDINRRLNELEELIDKYFDALCRGEGDSDKLNAGIEAAAAEQMELNIMSANLANADYYNTVYGPHGICCRLPENRLYYNGQRVMYLFDGHGDGASYQGNIWNDPDGAVSLVVNRNAAGEITGLEEIAPEDFPYPIMGGTTASGDSSISG